MRLGSLMIVKSGADSSSLQYLMARPHNSSTGSGSNGRNQRIVSRHDPFATPSHASRRPGSASGFGGTSVAPADYVHPSRFKRSSIPGGLGLDASSDKQQLASLMVFDRKYNGGGIAGRAGIDPADDEAGRISRAADRVTGGGKRPHQRLVFKNGECNVTRANIKKRRQRYMADIFTTLVDIKWRWNLLNFVLAFTLSWLIFALAWWLICFSHGDLNNYQPPEEISSAGGAGGSASRHKPCVEEVYDFTTALLFSIETQQTIGFGSRRTNPHCPEAILVMMCQSCFGVIIQALMTGLVFAKLSRPKKRAETLLFSKTAVICRRDGQLCLLFRVGDMRKSHIVEAHVRAILIKRRTTQEGEVVPLYQYDLQLGGPGETEGRLFMVWPVIVEHRINEDSPFWDLSADRLSQEQFELVVVLEGIVESTGMTTQARTSYLPSEILWGHRFERLVSYQRDNSQYMIDYSRFHSTVAIEIQPYSAKELAEMRDSGRGDGLNGSTSDESCSLEDDDEDDVIGVGKLHIDDADLIDDDVMATASVRSDPIHAIRSSQPVSVLRSAGHGAGQGQLRSAVGQHQQPPPPPPRRLSIPSLMRTNGINGVALAAFDLQPEDEQSFQTMIDCQSIVVTSAASARTDDGDAYRFM